MQPPPNGWPPGGGYPPAPPGYPPQGGYPQQGYPQQQGYGPAPMVYQQPAPMYACPMCRSNAPPLERDKISTAGWVIFAVLLICCFPLCFIGLTQKEKYRVCAHCNHRLGGVG